jgi:hypothetical protein
MRAGAAAVPAVKAVTLGRQQTEGMVPGTMLTAPACQETARAGPTPS